MAFVIVGYHWARFSSLSELIRLMKCSLSSINRFKVAHES